MRPPLKMRIVGMARAAIDAKDVRELQRLAQQSPQSSRRRPRKRYSRAAYLELIDILSRWSAAGLALMAGVGVYLAVTIGRTYPARTAAWTVLLIGALWIARSMRSRFRAGAAIAARPFRWRATYTSALCVLGVIFAAAPVLLTPVNAPAALFLQALALSMVGAFGAALFHSAHPPSAAAFALPGVALPLMAAIRSGDIVIVAVVGALCAIALSGLAFFGKALTELSARRNPRTTFLRREVETGDAEAVAETSGTAAQNAV